MADARLFPGEFATSASQSVSAILHTKDGKVLLQHRDDKPGVFYPSYWGLFGGRIEAGETPQEALVRELFEELAWETDVPDIPFTTLAWSGGGWSDSVRIRYIFLIEIREQDVLQMRLGEGQAMDLYAVDKLNGILRVMPHDLFALSMFTGEAYGSAPKTDILNNTH